MKMIIGLLSFFCLEVAAGPVRYWLIEEDLIKMGKKELYEEQKKAQIQPGVLGLKDLENPRYLYLTPLKALSSLEGYFSSQQKMNPLLDTCLHFKILSLHELKSSCSFSIDTLFSKQSSFWLYALYDIEPGEEKLFEEHLTSLSTKQSKLGSEDNRGVWKVLIGGDTPKYLICIGFPSKEKLKDASLASLVEEAGFKEILRDKKEGWVKREETLSSDSAR